MTEEQIMQAPIEEVIDRWCELYKTNIHLSVCINEKKDTFTIKDIKGFKKLIKLAKEEMNLIEKHRPEAID